MKDLLPFLVVGLSTGSIYGLAGVGLVLTYRTAGVFNFAHGAVAALGAYMFFELRTTHGWPWPVALVVSVLAGRTVSGVLGTCPTALLVPIAEKIRAPTTATQTPDRVAAIEDALTK